MTNELTKVELFGNNRDGEPINYIVASSAAIAKGTILQLLDPRTVQLAATAGAVIAGIAAEEHSGKDYSTTMSVWTQGIFNMVASGSITIGSPIATAAITAWPNTGAVTTLAVSSGAAIIGYANEAVSDTETFQLRLNL